MCPVPRLMRFFQAEGGIRDKGMWLEFRRVLFRSLEVRLGMRFFDADLEPGPAFQHGHFSQRSAAYPERHSEPIGGESRELHMVFAPENRGLPRSPRDEGYAALHRAPIAMI